MMVLEETPDCADSFGISDETHMTLTKRQSRKGRGVGGSQLDRPGPKILVSTMRQTMREFGDESPAIVADWIASVIDPKRPSATQLLTDPNVPLYRLNQAKNLYKLMRVYGETSAFRRVGLRLYAASIAAALMHHGERISEQSDKALSRGLHFLLEDKEMPAELRVMVVEVLDSLPKIDKHSLDLVQFERQLETLDYVADLPASTTLLPDTPRKPRKKRKQSLQDKDPELGYHYQVHRAYCSACREVMEIRRKLPNRKVHYWMTMITLGVWLIPWGIAEIKARFHYWRCINCRRHIYHSTLS